MERGSAGFSGFRGFSGVWTAAVAARRLRRDRPLSLTIAGEKIVFFRDAEGRARALLDACPHRGVALSLGEVKDGCLRCPFHGWRFDGDGRVCHVPYNPDAKRDQLGAVSFPVEEHVGVLWLFTGTAPTSPLQLPPALRRADLHHSVSEFPWRTHWTRVMENGLDSAHLPTVHRTSIGRGLAKAMQEHSRMDIDVEVTEFGARSTVRVDGVPQPGGLDFHRPNAMVLTIVDNDQQTFIQQLCMIPVDATHTRALLIGSRSFLKTRLFDPVFFLSNRKVALEDKRVVESSWPPEVPDPGAEQSVRTDRLSLIFRKYYRATLRAPLPILDDGPPTPVREISAA
jgi:phenylpropionate dioxygenase-like ring-hydroxylating dioxygenase large terminal subunit